MSDEKVEKQEKQEATKESGKIEKIGKAFLEFLQNLTPVILFISIGMVLWRRYNLELWTFNISNFKITLLIFIAFTIGFIAYLCNAFMLYIFFVQEGLIDNWSEANKKINKRIKEKGGKVTYKVLLFGLSWFIIGLAVFSIITVIIIYLLIFGDILNKI